MHICELNRRVNSKLAILYCVTIALSKQYSVRQKNSAVPLFALFQMCGTVLMHAFIDILYELPEDGNIWGPKQVATEQILKQGINLLKSTDYVRHPNV